VNQAVMADRWRAGIAALRRATSPPPRLSRAAWTADAVLAFVLAASTVYYAFTARSNSVIVPSAPRRPPIPGVIVVPHLAHGVAVGPGQLILAALTGLPLVMRRRYPLAAFWAVLVATLLFHASVRDPDTAMFTFASCLLAAYSAAVYSPYRAGAIASLVVGAGLLAVLHDANVPDITAGYVPFLVVLGFGLAANTIHTWKKRVAQLQAQQDEATRQAVQHERARIARELHDVVTHNVAVMVVQAGAARKVIDAAPDQARDALLAVEAGGRAALGELRHVMGLLTMSGDGPEPAELAPQPGLGQLAALAGRVRDTGVPVELTVTGTPTQLTAGVDLTAYRVVQEALTNTLKHAAGSSVRISVGYAHDSIRVEVADTGGVSTAADGSGNGRGLVGLRERLAVYGGTLQAGVLPAGGYRVRAVIPIEQP
jgi:signal transduction histidine kinase